MTGAVAFEKCSVQAKDDVNGKGTEQPSKRQRRYLEVLSIACSTLGLNIVISCFYGVTDVFGLKSPEIVFKCAFAFLLASVILGILAMVSSIQCLQVSSFSTSEYSLLYRLFRVFYNQRSKCIEDSKKITEYINAESEESPFSHVKYSDRNRNNQATVNHSDISSGVQCTKDEFSSVTPRRSGAFSQWKNRKLEGKPKLQRMKDEFPGTTPGQSVAFSQWKGGKDEDIPGVQHTGDLLSTATPCQSTVCFQRKTEPQEVKRRVQLMEKELTAVKPAQSSALLPWKKKPYEDKPLLRLKKMQTAVLFGQCTTAQVSPQYVNSRNLTLYNMEENNGRPRLIPIFQESFTAEISFNTQVFPTQRKQTDMFSNRPQIGISSYGLKNTDFGAVRDCKFPWKNQIFHETFQAQPKDQVSEVISKLNEIKFLS